MQEKDLEDFCRKYGASRIGYVSHTVHGNYSPKTTAAAAAVMSKVDVIVD